MPEWILAILAAYIFLLIAVPLIAVLIITVTDVIARQDIGFSRLVWAGVVLMVPLGGLLLYWLLRPKDFDPWQEPKPQRRVLAPREEPVLAASPVAAFSPRMTPALQGGADPEPISDESDTGAGA
jgi:hypothetical protein